MEAKNRRYQAVADMRKGLVLASARKVMARVGIENTSIREIAKEAGYTPGALYAYFDNRNQMLLTLLEQALSNWVQSVLSAKPGKAQPDVLLSRANAWIAYPLSQPKELELLMFFLGGVGQGNVEPDLVRRLHSALRQTLEPIAQCLLSSGMQVQRLNSELETLLSLGLGLLLAQNPAQLQPPELSPQELFAIYVSRLARDFSGFEAAEGAMAPPAIHAGQVDLFGL